MVDVALPTLISRIRAGSSKGSSMLIPLGVSFVRVVASEVPRVVPRNGHARHFRGLELRTGHRREVPRSGDDGSRPVM